MRRCDAIVVGGGAMGSATAWQLARRGTDVVLLEQFTPLHLKGSSHGASRIFRLAYPDNDYVRLALDARDAWHELEYESGAKLIDVTGGVDHGNDDTIERIAASLKTFGLTSEKLSAAEASERFSGMRFESDALFQPDAGRANADATVAALHAEATKRGAEMRFEEKVREMTPSADGVVVRTAAGEYYAPVAVVAAGGWVEKLVGSFVRLPPLRVSREQPAHFRALDPNAVWPSFLHYSVATGPAGFGTYGLETPGAGVKVGEHCTGMTIDPDTRDFVPEPERLDRLKRYVARWFPGLDPEPVDVITCIYTITPNEDFILDRTGPIVVCSPCSGHGFKFVPAIGAIAADLAQGKPGHPRFRLP